MGDINKDLREEIDNQQAQADGLLYVAAALLSAAVILFLYAPIDALVPKALVYTETPSLDLAAAVFCAGSYNRVPCCALLSRTIRRIVQISL